MINRSTCAATESGGSEGSVLKSRPVSLLCTRLYTVSARSLRVSGASVELTRAHQSRHLGKINVRRSVPLKISFSSARILLGGPCGCAAAPTSSAVRSAPVTNNCTSETPHQYIGRGYTRSGRRSRSWFMRRQLMRGSYTNASSTAINDSLLSRRTFMLISHVLRKLPSMPLTYIDNISAMPSQD